MNEQIKNFEGVLKMKIRNGFVSNSSSSSFVVNLSIEKVTKSMINDLIDFSETKTDKQRYKKLKEKIKNVFKLIQLKNRFVGLVLPSPFQDTYIFEKDNRCYIQTCNNIQWDIQDQASSNDETIFETIIQKEKFFNIIKNQIMTYSEIEQSDEITKEKEITINADLYQLKVDATKFSLMHAYGQDIREFHIPSLNISFCIVHDRCHCFEPESKRYDTANKLSSIEIPSKLIKPLIDYLDKKNEINKVKEELKKILSKKI